MPATILLVDDDEFILTVTQEVLEQSGYAIETAEDGLAAWERLEKDLPASTFYCWTRICLDWTAFRY